MSLLESHKVFATTVYGTYAQHCPNKASHFKVTREQILLDAHGSSFVLRYQHNGLAGSKVDEIMGSKSETPFFFMATNNSSAAVQLQQEKIDNNDKFFVLPACLTAPYNIPQIVRLEKTPSGVLLLLRFARQFSREPRRLKFTAISRSVIYESEAHRIIDRCRVVQARDQKDCTTSNYFFWTCNVLGKGTLGKWTMLSPPLTAPLKNMHLYDNAGGFSFRLRRNEKVGRRTFKTKRTPVGDLLHNYASPPCNDFQRTVREDGGKMVCKHQKMHLDGENTQRIFSASFDVGRNWGSLSSRDVTRPGLTPE